MQSFLKKKAAKVLILVVMEDSIWRTPKDVELMIVEAVLILVVMEDSIWRVKQSPLLEVMTPVLILVVMEDSIWPEATPVDVISRAKS